MDISLSKLWEIVKDRKAWPAAVHGVTRCRARLSDWTTAPNPITWRPATSSTIMGSLTARLWACSRQSMTKGSWWCRRSGQHKLVTSDVRTTVSKNAQVTFRSIWHMIWKNKYHPDLCMATIPRARAILCNQKSVMVKKKWTHPIKKLLNQLSPLQSNKAVSCFVSQICSSN